MSIRRRWLLGLWVACWIANLAAGPATAACTTDMDCEDGNPCTANRCSSRGRCRDPEPLAVPESSCTPGVPPPPCFTDVCTAQAACMRVAKCIDGNPCTDDLCDAGGACSYVARADGASCTADACGSAGICHTGECQGTACDDSNPCTEDACGANGQCTHGDMPTATPCAPDQYDCRVFRCDGHGSCQPKAAAENATCLVPTNRCSPWGLCKGSTQTRRCELLPSACPPGQPCATDGLDCSGTTLCGLVSTCSGGTCVDLTCDVGATVEPCGFRCGSAMSGSLCMAVP